MLVHPDFNPIALSFGPLAIRWYGLMYLVGFMCFWFLGKYRTQELWRGFNQEDLEDMLFYGVLGIVLGGRLGYCLFYQMDYYMAHPIDIFKVWQGGMSAHGGILGAITVMFFFARSRAVPFFQVSDFVAPLVPLGLFAGRLGNFINGELWGRVSDGAWPWLMMFPQALDGGLPRHPSQLYEAFMEGLLLFIVLWLFSKKRRPLGAVSGLFCVGYGLARFIVEFFREPDAFLGLQALGLSRGQWLSVPVIMIGIALLVWSYRRQKTLA